VADRKRRGPSGGRAWTLLSPPMLPDWGGAGPLIWRQIVAFAGRPTILMHPLIATAAVAAPARAEWTEARSYRR